MPTSRIDTVFRIDTALFQNAPIWFKSCCPDAMGPYFAGSFQFRVILRVIPCHTVRWWSLEKCRLTFLFSIAVRLDIVWRYTCFSVASFPHPPLCMI